MEFFNKRRIINRQNYNRIFQYITGSLFFFDTNFLKNIKRSTTQKLHYI